MTIITLTPEQAAELANDFWHIPYTVTIDGVDVDAHTDDEGPVTIPVGVDIGEPAVDDPDNPSEYYVSDSRVTWEDEVMIAAELDERAAFTATLAAANPGQRQGLLRAERQRLVNEARQDAQRAARANDRRQGRDTAARHAARQAFQEKHAAAIEAARPPAEEP